MTAKGAVDKAMGRLSLTLDLFFVLIACELEFEKNGGQMDQE
jgi:hypothetical protein